ncbi:MAG: hypothetical protein WB992_00595, partial [Bryobacteraceae bacterium]
MQICNNLKTLGTALSALMVCAAFSPAQEPGKAPSVTGAAHWTALTHQPTAIAPRLSLLLTDGRILVQDNTTFSTWQIFTPDSTGSYINGTWGLTSTLPAGYAPLYFASAVLADGRVVIVGGEYNQGAEMFTKLGAYYRPFLNTWSTLA